MEQSIKEKVKIFRAFSDEKRLLILQELQKGERCACDLIEIAKICQSSLSYQMGILLQSGIVQQRSEGKWNYYSISEKGSKKALSLLRSMTKKAQNEQPTNNPLCVENGSCCK